MPLEDIVNVSITRETAAVAQTNFGIPAILTANANTSSRVSFFSSLSSFKDALTNGILDPAYAAARAIFSQNPHPSSIAMLAIQGTKTITDNAGTYTAGSIVAIVNGHTVTQTYSVDKNGTLTALAVLIAALAEVASAVYNSGTHTILITPETGFVLEVSVDVSGITGAMTVDLSATGTETITDALDNAIEVDNTWYGLILESRTTADQEDAADWAETNNKICGLADDDANIINQSDSVDTTSIAHYVKSNALVRTFVFYHATADGTVNDDYIDAALLGKILPKDAGTYTAMFKTLSSVAVSTLTTTQQTNALAKNCNVYENIGGKNISREGKVGEGEYIDIIILVDWLDARITENVYLSLSRPDKVPYTNDGIATIQQAIDEILKIGQNRGGISPTEFDDEDIQIGGYYITVPTLSSIASADKAARLLQDVKFTAFLAGAVHAVQIDGIVTL